MAWESTVPDHAVMAATDVAVSARRSMVLCVAASHGEDNPTIRRDEEG